MVVNRGIWHRHQSQDTKYLDTQFSTYALMLLIHDVLIHVICLISFQMKTFCYLLLIVALCLLLQLEKRRLDFFPINRAISLQHEEDSNEQRLDTLMQQVRYLVKKMEKEV